MRTAKKRTAVAIVLATFALFADAQMDGGMRRGKELEGGRGAEREKSGPPAQSSVDQLGARLYDLRMRLLITPAQAPAWESFYARWMDRAGPRAGVEPAETPGSSALHAVQRQLALDRGRVALTESLYAATENLYGQLEPEQQRTADQWLPQLLMATTVERPAKVWARDSAR